MTAGVSASRSAGERTLSAATALSHWNRDWAPGTSIAETRSAAVASISSASLTRLIMMRISAWFIRATAVARTKPRPRHISVTSS